MDKPYNKSILSFAIGIVIVNPTKPIIDELLKLRPYTNIKDDTYMKNLLEEYIDKDVQNSTANKKSISQFLERYLKDNYYYSFSDIFCGVSILIYYINTIDTIPLSKEISKYEVCSIEIGNDSKDIKDWIKYIKLYTVFSEKSDIDIYNHVGIRYNRPYQHPHTSYEMFLNDFLKDEFYYVIEEYPNNPMIIRLYRISYKKE